MLAGSRKFILTVIFLIATIVVVNAQGSCTTLSMEPGVCVPILTCATIVELLTLSAKPPPSVIQLVQLSHCGTFNDVHHVCCAPDRVTGRESPVPTPEPTTIRTTVTTTRSITTDNKIRPSDAKTNEDVQSGMAILEATKCGKSYADRVANGEDADLSEFPWMALLIYDDGLDRTLDCGGSLITNQYVLTAAHCIRVGTKRLVGVRLGEYDTKSTMDCVTTSRKRKCAPPIQEIDIEEAIYNRAYSPSQFSDDIGIIRLATKVVFNTNIQPICLPITPSSQTEAINRMTIAGWGRIENGLKASVLQKALVPVRDIEFCQAIHRVIRITDKQLCAGGENEIDTCKGDSGGPIFSPARYRRSSRFVQYGIVSAGSSLCGSNFPGIYVRVTSYLSWIAGNIRP